MTRHPSEDRTVHAAHINHHSAMTHTIFRSVIGSDEHSIFRLFDVDFATAKEVIEFAVCVTEITEFVFAKHVVCSFLVYLVVLSRLRGNYTLKFK